MPGGKRVVRLWPYGREFTFEDPPNDAVETFLTPAYVDYYGSFASDSEIAWFVGLDEYAGTATSSTHAIILMDSSGYRARGYLRDIRVGVDSANVVTNGDMEIWSGGKPAGWGKKGSVTVTQGAERTGGGGSYSVKMTTGSTGQVGIYRSVPLVSKACYSMGLWRNKTYTGGRTSARVTNITQTLISKSIDGGSAADPAWTVISKTNFNSYSGASEYVTLLQESQAHLLGLYFDDIVVNRLEERGVAIASYPTGGGYNWELVEANFDGMNINWIKVFEL